MLLIAYNAHTSYEMAGILTHVGIEDLSGNACDFDNVKWIGKGHKYPVNPSAALRAYQEAIYKIPIQYQKILIPEPSLNIIDFISLELPETIATLIDYSAKNCYLKREPTEDIICLTKRNLPSRTFVNDAKSHFGQAILDGAKSIADPHYKGGSLPLWVVSFWDRMLDVREEQKTWQKATQWLRRHWREDKSSRMKIINECWALLGSLEWDTKLCLPGGAGLTVNLAQLLEDQMVSGDIVDMMVQYLGNRIKQDTSDISQSYDVATLSFMDLIDKEWKARRASTGTISSYLRRLQTQMKISPKVLLFPVNLPKMKYYIGFAIDFKKKTIYYGKHHDISKEYYAHCNYHHNLIGDSLKASPPTEKDLEVKAVYKYVQWWLEANFDEPFNDDGCTMDYGVHQDGISCAITTANMISHEIFGDPLWNVSRAVDERVRWFNRLA